MRARAPAIPIAAPVPSNHHAEMPAYDFVVVSKPPFAYERANTQPATASPRTALRESASQSCSSFVIPLAASSTGEYSSAMPAGLRHVAGVATAAFFIALALPAAALAGNGHKCNASACRVYVEPALPKAGGSGPGQQNPTGGSGTGSTQTKTPSNVSRVLAQAGSDQGALKNLVAADTGLGQGSSEAGDNGSPSALGAAFDLGSGPTILLAILLATVVALGAHGGLRSWRRRRATG